MDGREILIREATPDDLGSIHYFYSNYMFDSYLINLGRPFVKKYLEIILRSKNCVSLVATESHICGFIMAAFNGKKLVRGFLFNFEILLLWIRQFFLSPNEVFKSLGLVLYPFNTGIKNVNAELLFIAIDPEFRKRNLAAGLINKVLNLMKQKGVKKVKVSTLVSNEPVNALLIKLGFQIRKTFKLFKKDMYLYEYELC